MLLGKGATSSVYLLQRNDSKCALKTNPNQREVEFLKKMNHSNIIQFLNVHPQGILLEACIGDLQHVFDSHIDVTFMIDLWIYQLLDALSYLQKSNIIHRDVKLANILLNDQYDIKLNDFGLAMNTHERKELAGTPNYLSPELLKRQAPCHKSDVYAAGVCCFALLTGTLPFEGGTAKQTLTNIVKQTWQPNLLPLSYKHLVSSMMNPNPQSRISANECLSGDHFFTLFTPLETIFITPFSKILADNKLAVLKTGDIILQHPGCAVHINGSVTLLHPNVISSFFDDSSKCLEFDANALFEVFSQGTTMSTTQLSIPAKQGLRIALDTANKLYKRFHSVMIQGLSFRELLDDFIPDTTIIKDSPWRAVLWKNDDFHFRCYDVIVRFIRSSEVIEIYEPLSPESSFLNVLPTAPISGISPFLFHCTRKCSVRGIPNEFKLLINLAQAALKKCLHSRTPCFPNYTSLVKMNSFETNAPSMPFNVPIYHPSSEFVKDIGWLIQIPGDKGNMTVELLAITGERVRIVDDHVFTFNLINREEGNGLSRNLNGLQQLGPQKQGCKVYKKSEIPEHVKWFIQRFR